MSCFQCSRQGKRQYQYTAEGLYAASAACLRRKGLLSEKPSAAGISGGSFYFTRSLKWFFFENNIHRLAEEPAF